MKRNLWLIIALFGLAILLPQIATTESGSSGKNTPALPSPEKTKEIVLSAIDNAVNSKGYNLRKDINVDLNNKNYLTIKSDCIYKNKNQFVLNANAKINDATDERSALLHHYQNDEKSLFMSIDDIKKPDRAEIKKGEPAKDEFSEGDQIFDFLNYSVFKAIKESILNATCTGLIKSAANQPAYLINLEISPEGLRTMLKSVFTQFDEELSGKTDIINSLNLEIDAKSLFINQINQTLRIAAKNKDSTITASAEINTYFSDFNSPTIDARLADGIKNIIDKKDDLQKEKDEPSDDEKPLSKIEANEISTMAGLKMLISTQAIWRATDTDGNGIKDYWNLDVSCFYRMYRADGKTRVNYIDLSFALADAAAYSRTNPRPFGCSENIDEIENWSDAKFTPKPKNGYWFRAMQTNMEGKPFTQTEIIPKGILSGNITSFAFVAYPDIYGVTGRHVFIIDVGGTIYQIDPGSDANKVVLQWPGDPPTAVNGPGGNRWEPAE
ncbi:MAG: DUF2950 family protein [Candidatus Brocadiia bacterium]